MGIMVGIDFHHVFEIIVQALGPLCVLFAPTLAIERALNKALKEDTN